MLKYFSNKSQKVQHKILNYNGRGDKLLILQNKLSDKKDEFAKNIRSRVYTEVLGSFKVHIFPKYPQYEEMIRKSLISKNTYKQVYTYALEVFDGYNVDDKIKKIIINNVNEIIRNEQVRHQDDIYPIVSSIENIESTIGRKDKDDIFNGDDEFSKHSSFILKFKELKIKNMKILKHRLYHSIYLLEYSVADDNIGETVYHIPSNKRKNIIVNTQIKDKLISAINDSYFTEDIKLKLILKLENELI